MRLSQFFLIISVSLLACLSSKADDIRTVSIEYEYVSAEKNESPQQAEQNAIQRARVEALAKEYGWAVADVSTMTTQSNTVNDQADYRSSFSQFTESAVQGEWIETVTQKILKKEYQDGVWRIKVFLKGKTRKQVADIPLAYGFYGSDVLSVKKELFACGERFIMSFSAPVAGHLLVYGVDENDRACCLLPYSDSSEGSYPIAANTEYTFFSQKTDIHAEEIFLCPENGEEEELRLFILFSPNALVKPTDKDGGVSKDGYDRLRELPMKEFKKWLDNRRLKDASMVVRFDAIRVVKN